MTSRIPTSVSDIKPSSDALTAHLEGEAVLLHIGTKQYFRLNRTGAHIWKALESGMAPDAIAASLVAAFEVSDDDAREAVRSLLAELVAGKLVTES